ncbi:MAG TPA: hypothetical protein VGK67_32150 [Myxococcales bacterium]
MRFARLLLAAAALAAFAGSACTKNVQVQAPPKVDAGPDLRLQARPSVVLGATAYGSADIESYEWKVVTAPDITKTAITSLSSSHDIAQLETGSVPGLYVVAVRATDVDGLTSAWDFVDVALTSSAELVKIALRCTEGCRNATTGPDPFVANENASLTFAVDVLSGAPDGINWSFTLDGPDGSHTEPAVLTPAADGRSAVVELPRCTRDLSLSVTATAYVSGLNDSSASIAVIEENTLDEPPTLALEWHIPGGKPGDQVRLLPGDAIYLKAVASDPNGDAISCEFPPSEEGGPYVLQPVTDPCSRTLYPLQSGTITIAVNANTNKPEGTARATLTLQVAPFRVVTGAGAVADVAINDDGFIVAADQTAGYRVYDAKDATLTAANVAASFTGSTTAAFFGSRAVVGFSGSKNLSAYDLTTSTKMPDVVWPAASPNPATGTLAMATSAKTGRVWLAMSEGIGVFDPSPLAASTLSYWAGGPVLPTAIAWGPSPMTPSNSGYVWYAAGNKVYCQQSEAMALWSTANVVGTVPGIRISAMAYGNKTGDLWVGTAPTGGVSTGFPVYLYRDAVDPANGDPRMNAPLDFFAPYDGGIGGVAVEQDGPYAGDAWVAAGGMVMRVSRAVVDEAVGERGALGLELTTAVPGVALKISVAGRRVAVAAKGGLAVVP